MTELYGPDTTRTPCQAGLESRAPRPRDQPHLRAAGCQRQGAVHWLNGQTPRGALPELAAVTLSRALSEQSIPCGCGLELRPGPPRLPRIQA